jgi:uncharacterized protein YjiS (DUF1127 family)
MCEAIGTRRIHRLTLALQLLDDSALAQLGLERADIERFAQAAVTHDL